MQEIVKSDLMHFYDVILSAKRPLISGMVYVIVILHDGFNIMIMTVILSVIKSGIFP